MRNRMGCLVFGILALLVMVFFNGGGSPIAEVPSGVEGTASGGMGESDSGGLEPLGDLGELDAEDDGSEEELSLDLESIDGADGESGDDAAVGMLTEEVTAQVSNVQYTVLDATNEGSTIDTLEAEGEFILVSLLMKNNGSEPLTYFGANMIDDHGQEYSYISDALDYIVDEEACEVITIEPGEEQICTMVYDVNDDANAIGLVLTDLNLLGGEESVVELTGLP